ncbi:hypothetical protein ISCGN_027773 [Ixodes scapularis]
MFFFFLFFFGTFFPAYSGSRSGIPIAPSKSAPNGAGLYPTTEPPSPTKSLERRPPVVGSVAIETLRTPEERGFKDTLVLVYDARTGCASSLKLLAENTVNEAECASPLQADRHADAGSMSSLVNLLKAGDAKSDRKVDLASSEGSGEPVAEVTSEVSSTQGAKFSSETVQNCVVETVGPAVASAKDLPVADHNKGDSPSTGTLPCKDSSLKGQAVAASEALEIAVVPPPPPPPPPHATREVATQAALLPAPERRPDDRPANFRQDPPSDAPTLPLQAAAILRDQPLLRQRQRHSHAIRPVVSPLISRWCCAKISFVSMAVMSLFAAFVFYAFKEDTFVDLVNWAVTWNTTNNKARMLVTYHASTLRREDTVPETTQGSHNASI